MNHTYFYSMKRFYFNLLILIAFIGVSTGAKAVGWPANYEGVMLQGFYWDSYNETSWVRLTNQADELSQSFKLIWVPNSAQAAGNPNMGYMPIYYFSHHSSSFGNEAALKAMIAAFKEKGVGIIEDVVINHRVGVRDWADFPSETWKGVTYTMDASSVCRTDEWGKGTGAADTGDDFNGARDLDHTNANVQNVLKNYCKFLIDELGYVGFRLDMVKGYGGQYTKIYNQYAKPQFSVGEYFDSNYDLVARWIEATGKESAAFDFPFKYAVNEAFHSGDLTKLVWKANGTTDQPAGMIHYGYPQFAVTFIDNHDTYRDGSKFNGNVMAANAFMLCSPGTPCVFWPHYTANKTAMKALIAARNAVGVHNMSKVEVMRTSRDCYMAKVYGTKGSLVVKIGSASVTAPTGYTMAASGNDYCVWTSPEGGIVIPTPDPNPFTVYFKNTKGWITPYIHYWGASESTWPGVAMTKVNGTTDIWSYKVPAGTTGCLFNAGDGDATKTGDMAAQANHLYTPDGDQGIYNGDNPTTYPASLYLMGHVNGYTWATDQGVKADGKGVYTFNNVTVDDAGEGSGYFAFATVLGPDWDAVNAGDRYGAATDDEPISMNGSAKITLYAANVSASGSKSWMLKAGKYNITADLTNMTVSVADPAGIDDAQYESTDPVEYFNLQGIRVEEPSNGIYIRRQGTTVTKVYIK